MSAASAASLKLKTSGSTHSAENARCHHCGEKPRGGNCERLEALNDTAAVMRIGPSMKT